MLNLKNGCLTNPVKFCDFLHRDCTDQCSYFFNLFRGKLSKFRSNFTDMRRYSFGDMLRALLATAPVVCSSSGGFRWHFSFAHGRHFLDVFFAFLSSGKESPGFCRTFGSLFSSDVSYRHLVSSIFARIKPRCAIAPICHVGKVCARVAIMSNPFSLCFTPVPLAKFYYLYDRSKVSGQKLSNPMRLVAFDFRRGRNVRAYSLCYVERPADITHCVIAWVFKYVYVPCSFFIHICIVSRNLCGYKREYALCGYDGEGHEDLERCGWTAHAWKAHGGYGSQGEGAGRENAEREVIWFSPHCPGEVKRLSLFDMDS